jgi:hypothetical protein
MFTQTIKILSVGDLSQQRLHWISYVDECRPKLHYVEDPHFSRLLHSNMSAPLVGKKVANVVCNSESSNRNESLHSLLVDKGNIVDCSHAFLLEKKARRPKCRKGFILTLDEQNKPRLSSHIYDSKNSVISISLKTWLKTTL